MSGPLLRIPMLKAKPPVGMDWCTDGGKVDAVFDVAYVV